jgi:hypothetical protein
MKLSAAVLVLGLGAGAPFPLHAQRTLDEAAQGARYAWMTHDGRMLATSADSLVLRLPGMDEVTARSGQASRLINRYLETTVERSFELRAVRETGEGQGYAEAVRRYVVRGTADVVEQTVFLGFRQSGGRWKLTEIRISP